MGGHAIGTHDAALRLVLGLDRIPDPRYDRSVVAARPLANKRILDLGAGPNPWPWVAGGPDYIAGRGLKVSVDLPGVTGPDHAHLWEDRRVGLDLNYGLSLDLVCAAGLFDVVIAVEVIEHIENPWLLMRGIAGALSPTGVAVVSSPDISRPWAREQYAQVGMLPWFPADCAGGHITPIFPHLLAEMARRAGLRIDGEAWNEPPPHWVEQATREEIDSVTGTIKLWRLRRATG